MSNQLRAELERFWPGPIGLFAELTSPISFAFIERYPSPVDARTLGEQGHQSLLKRERYSGHRAPSELLARLRRAPQGRAGETELQARRVRRARLGRRAQAAGDPDQRLQQQIADAVHAHPDDEIFLSLFRAPTSVICSATLLAEIGDCRALWDRRRARWRRRPRRRRDRIGQRKVTTFRWGCDHRLRQAVGTLADTTRH